MCALSLHLLRIVRNPLLWNWQADLIANTPKKNDQTHMKCGVRTTWLPLVTSESALQQTQKQRDNSSVKSVQGAQMNPLQAKA